MEFVEIKCRVCGKSNSFWWCKGYSAIWSNSREHLKNVFAVSLGYQDNVHEFWEKHSPNVLEDQTRLQNSAYTTRKSLIFRVLCALFEQIPSDINQDILKNPIWCGAKNSNTLCAPCHLLWSGGFPTLYNVYQHTNVYNINTVFFFSQNRFGISC